MQPQPGQDKKSFFFDTLQSRYGLSRRFLLLSLFLLAVILITYIIPVVDFGRFFGTDDYTHLFHTQQMGSSTGLSYFFEDMGNFVSDPSSDANLYNYPFGLWLFGGSLAKITGLTVVNGAFLLVILFLFVILGSFYLYSGTFLESKEQKILAVLFLVAMPNVAFSLLSYRPSVFILPFLFILMYLVFKEPFQWRLLPIVWLSIFIIIISHTGTLIFLVSFSILFYLLYCLLWGRVSVPMYLTLLSTLVIYTFSLAWFPEIANQYDVKSTLFLSPGDFLASKFNFSLPSELGNLFYQNVMVNHELAYTIVLSAFIFILGKLFRFIHRKIMERFSSNVQVFPAVTLPISNISHSVAATPLWVGPLHVILSFFGFFRLDSKGKCLLFSLVLVTVLPDMLFEGASTTGALREISFLALIIPITTALGFCQVISYLETKYSQNKIFPSIVWLVMLLVVIMTPAFVTTYYLPKISGENYIIEGMRWLGNNGDVSGAVIGYGYRTVPIYTNMTDAGYGVQSGYETRTLKNLLSGTFFTSEERYVDDLRRSYKIKYILMSDKIAMNLGGSGASPVIDNNTAMDKIYSSKDFGVYDITLGSKSSVEKSVSADNISIENTGSSIQVETDVYNVVLNGNYPVIERFGTPKDNYLGEGFFLDSIQISGLRQESYSNPFVPINESLEQNTTVDRFILNNLSIVPEIQDNQITYRTVLKDQLTGENESSFVVLYTFYPTTIKREFFISNDWETSPVSPQMNVGFSTNLFTPLNDFIIKGNQSYLKRHIYPSQDSVRMDELFNSLYFYEGDRGIYLKIEPTAPYPSSSIYKGSTLYNMSSFSFSQADALKPGATLHITQYLSPGDEVTAEKNIQVHERISLLNYPGGMVPIILAGYRTPDSDTGSTELIEQGYRVLLNESIPYTEVVVPEQVRKIPVVFENTTKLTAGLTEPPALATIVTTVNLPSLHNRNIKIIGSSTTTDVKYYYNYRAQADNITSVIKKARDTDVPLIGYMPTGLNYNLDTLKIVSDNSIALMLSTPVSPPYYGVIGMENRNPQQAWYYSEPSNVTLLPVSYPLSTSLSTETDTSEILSAWKSTIDESVVTDGMVLFIIRSADIGNPEYTDAIRSLIDYAKTKGLTFTTPDVIADHFKKIENVRYTGSVMGDTASIILTNNNEAHVRDVTLRVVMPSLKTGAYNVTEAEIVRTKPDGDNIIIYINTDIPALGSKKIIIKPAEPKKTINVTMPQYPIEGLVTISVNDMAGNPLTGAEAIIDTKYYSPDKNGNIIIDLKRGTHTVQIQMPGYERYNVNMDVKGRIYLLESFLRRVPD
jgi:hypothetical protein